MSHMPAIAQPDEGIAVTTTRTLTAGTGLAGGGDLSADRTFSLADTAVAPGTYADPTLTVNQQGQITSISSGSVVNPPYVHTVTSGEAAAAAGTGQFTHTLSVPQADTSFIANVTDGGRVDGSLAFFVCPVANYTTTTILIKCTQAPATGDKIIVAIERLT